MQKLGYAQFRFRTACDLVGRKHFCSECAAERAMSKRFSGRPAQKRMDRLELSIAEQEQFEERQTVAEGF